MGLFAEPRDPKKGSMIDSEEFEEFRTFYRYLQHDLVIGESKEQGKNLTYMDYCGKMCDLNDILFKTYVSYALTCLLLHKKYLCSFRLFGS